MMNRYKEFSDNTYKISLPESVEFILNKLNNAGFEAFIIGGCVRDSLLQQMNNGIKKEVYDWDITTSATPDETIEVFKEYTLVKNAVKYGTVSVILDGITYEMTAYRRDAGYSNNRQPDSISFANSLIEDCERRDFTINAIAYSHETGVIDIFNGMNDLKSGIIKCIGNADDRFKEDALRILRALRFSSTFDFKIEDGTSCAIFKNKNLLDNISGERKFMELSKIANTLHMANMLSYYKEILFQIIPKFKDSEGFDQMNPHHKYDVLSHILKAVKFACHRECNKYVVLAALFHDIGKPDTFEIINGVGTFRYHVVRSEELTREILSGFNCSNEIKDRICFLISMHDVHYPDTMTSARRFVAKYSQEQIDDLYELKMCDLLAHADITIELYMPLRIKSIALLAKAKSDMEKENAAFTVKDLDINGDDLIAIGIKPGKNLA